MNAHISISKSVFVDVDFDVEDIADQLSEETLLALLREKGGDYVPQKAQFERVYYDMAGKDCPQSLRELIFDHIGRIL